MQSSGCTKDLSIDFCRDLLDGIDDRGCNVPVTRRTGDSMANLPAVTGTLVRTLFAVPGFQESREENAMTRVRDLMIRNPNTVHPDTSLAQGVELMQDVACRHLPVLENGMVVGIISDRDLRTSGANMQHMEVAEFMTPDPITIGPGASVKDAARMLNDNAISALPVIADGSLVGILTVYDILEYVIRLPEPVTSG